MTVFSQTEYPKTVIINKDTVTQFYSWQAKNIARQLIIGDNYKDLYFITEDQLNLCQEVSSNKDSIINLQNVKIDFINEQIIYKDSIIYNKDNIISSQFKIINLQKKKEKKQKIIRWTVTILGIVATEELFRNIYKNR